MNEYWDKEVAVRMVTEKLTSREWDDLNDLFPTKSRKEALAYFGNPATRRVWEDWAKELIAEHQPPLRPGDVVNPRDELWILLKGCMRAKQQQDLERDTGVYAGCCCLAKTYFMPRGCGCQRSTSSRTSPPSSSALQQALCGQCSVCMRCGKLLGINWQWTIIT